MCSLAQLCNPLQNPYPLPTYMYVLYERAAFPPSMEETRKAMTLRVHLLEIDIAPKLYHLHYLQSSAFG